MDDAIATVHVTIKEWKAGSAYRGMGRRGSFLNGRRRWLVLVFKSKRRRPDNRSAQRQTADRIDN